MIEFVVYGTPKGKGRPRFRKMGKFVQTYTDEQTTNYENLVRLSYVNSGCKSYLEDTKPLIMELDVYLEIPKNVSKKKLEKMINNEELPTKKPDLDNIVKSIWDGLNKVAYSDDKQITTLIANKYYSLEPRVKIKIFSKEEKNL